MPIPGGESKVTPAMQKAAQEAAKKRAGGLRKDMPSPLGSSADRHKQDLLAKIRDAKDPVEKRKLQEEYKGL